MEEQVTPQKRCPKCSQDKPATIEFWHRAKNGKYGLYDLCKECRKIKPKESLFPEGYKQCTGPCGQVYLISAEFWHHAKKSKDGFRSKCKTCILEQTRGYQSRAEIKERTKERRKEYYSRPEIQGRVKEHSKEYYARPEVKDYKRNYDKERRKRPEIIADHRICISTVFLVMDHSYTGVPDLYETMVFLDEDNASLEKYTRRYSTRDEAVKGHQDVVGSIK